LTRISLRPIAAPAFAQDGLRPVNLRTDLRPLADLIELVFADSMDSSGRSAIREMRYLSSLGYGLKLIARLNELALGISLGFVYVLDGKLVGNVSVYPASYPGGFGEIWILANVGVHPDYQRRGIAGELVRASLDMIRRRGAARVILQVNYRNEAALRLYQRQGFIYERAWQVWRRSGFLRAPAPSGRELQITRLRQRDWQAEYALAQAARPNSRGGLGWLKPVHRGAFNQSLWGRLRGLFALSSVDKMIIRGNDSDSILASCWVESALGLGNIRAWFFADPAIDYQPYAQALLSKLVSRFDRSTIVFEHPKDDAIVNDLLKTCQFTIKRDLWHMRLDL
jgi:predicted N-acetyltransferase YhbS